MSISVSDVMVCVTNYPVTPWLLFSRPCIKRQFLLEYHSCQLICCSVSLFLFSRIDTRFWKHLISSFFIFLTSLYFFIMRSTELVNCFSPLTWFSLVVCSTSRSSRSDMFCKKGVLKNFPKFTGKHLYQSLFFNKVADANSVHLE